MSRSNPPRSSIVARLRRSNVSPTASPSAPRHRTYRRRLAIRFAALARWLHIYLSMFGLAAVLFFSVTGITLNHPTWFFGETERRMRSEGRIEAKWLRVGGPPPSSSPDKEVDLSAQVKQLEVVEHLRKTHGIHGALAEFRVEESECFVAFKGPGYAADAFINRRTGQYTLTQTFHGVVAILNDLHKGRDTGKTWSIVIDVSAVLMTLISLTGLILLFYLKLRRVPGSVVVLIGAIVVILAYLYGVP
jgi:hypothetical protein